MPTEYAIEEIRKDALELPKIAIDDNISNTQVLDTFHLINYGIVNHWSMGKITEEVKQYSDEQDLLWNPAYCTHCRDISKITRVTFHNMDTF